MSKCVFFCLYWGEDWVWQHRHKAQIDVVLQWCLSFCRFLLSPHMIMELNYSDIRILVSTLTKVLLRQLLSLAKRPPNPGCFKLLPLRVTETTCFCEPSMKQNFIRNSSPVVCLDTNLFLSSTDCSFDPRACFLLWSALSAIKPFIKTCVPFRIIPFNWMCHRLPSLKV